MGSLTTTAARRAPRRHGITCDGSFDIETYKWSRFVVGAIKAHGNLFLSWDENKCIEYMLSLSRAETPTVLYSHNGGRYDDLWFLARIVDMGFPTDEIGLSLAGQRIVRVEIGSLILLDSAALVPFRLEKAAGLGSVPKIDTDLPCVCQRPRPAWWPKWAKRGCGGFCSITPHMSRAHKKRLEWYLEHDVEAVPSMLDGLETFASRYDIDLKITLGSSAWATARRKLGLPAADWRLDGLKASAVYNFVRTAYYGGRCQVGRPKAPRVYGYDINAAYPFALSRVALPTGDFAEHADGSAAYAAGKEGVFLTTVQIPSDMHIPPLPARTKHRIAYPTGELSGVWCGNELRHAEAAGARILSMSQSIVWEESAVLFGAWLTELGNLRSQFKRDAKAAEQRGDKQAQRVAEAFAEWLKWLPNSVTGKLAQHPENEAVVMNPDPSKLGCPADARCYGVACSKDLGCCAHHCYGTCEGQGMLPLGDPRMRIYVKEEYRLNANSHVVWAGYLTANTRCQWWDQAMADDEGGRTWCYGDTDSIKATSPRTHDVDIDGTQRQGMWKFEGTWAEWDALAPKTYSGIDEETGEFHARSKGIIDAAHNFDALARGDTIVMDRGVKTFKTAANDAARTGKSLFEQKLIARQIHQRVCDTCGWRHYGDRILGADGLTHPQDADTFHEMP